MSKNSKVAIGILIILLILSLGGYFYYNNYRNANNTSTPLNTIKTLVGYMFFDQGSYRDYSRLFLAKSRVQNIKEINDFKTKKLLPAYFPGDDSLENVMLHMKVEYQGDNNASVYWKGEKTSSYNPKWELTRVQNKWLIKN